MLVLVVDVHVPFPQHGNNYVAVPEAASLKPHDTVGHNGEEVLIYFLVNIRVVGCFYIAVA